MPRKNSGMWYEVHPTPVKGDDGGNIVYVRPMSGMKLTMKELEKYCERTYNMRYGEMSRAFDMFLCAAGRYWLHHSRHVCPLYWSDALFCPQAAERVDQGRQAQTAQNASWQGAYLYRGMMAKV